MKLIQLFYTSQATSEINISEIEDILCVARENNEKIGITGLLMFKDNLFYQCIEGLESDINAIFSKIAIDDRHHNVQVMGKIKIEKRSFNDWKMGFVNLDEQQKKDGFSDINKALELAQKNTLSLVKFMEFYSGAADSNSAA